MIFRWRNERGNRATVAESAPAPPSDQDVGSLLTEIDRLEQESRGQDDPETLRLLVDLRHQAGVKLINSVIATPDYPSPSLDLLAGSEGGLPEFRPGELTPELLRAAILRDGCAVVRGLVDRDRATDLAESCRRLFEQREHPESEDTDGDLCYQEFVADPQYQVLGRQRYQVLGQQRQWVHGHGGIWLADSPKLMSDVFDIYERVGLRRLINGYLRERPVIALNKSTLRRALAGRSTMDWHQDGAFMGDVRTLNIWMSLSRCGDVAPGLAMIPRRVDHVVPTGTPGAAFDWSVSPAVAEDAAGEAGILRPIFEPGDVVLFDDLFLHATWVDSEMPNPRYAVESWFFSPAGFPHQYVPLVF